MSVRARYRLLAALVVGVVSTMVPLEGEAPVALAQCPYYFSYPMHFAVATDGSLFVTYDSDVRGITEFGHFDRAGNQVRYFYTEGRAMDALTTEDGQYLVAFKDEDRRRLPPPHGRIDFLSFDGDVESSFALDPYPNAVALTPGGDVLAGTSTWHVDPEVESEYALHWFLRDGTLLRQRLLPYLPESLHVTEDGDIVLLLRIDGERSEILTLSSAGERLRSIAFDHRVMSMSVGSNRDLWLSRFEGVVDGSYFSAIGHYLPDGTLLDEWVVEGIANQVELRQGDSLLVRMNARRPCQGTPFLERFDLDGRSLARYWWFGRPTSIFLPYLRQELPR